MKKYQCIVCGWVYDEALGCPEEGILPGTRWEDIPEDWTCPECGAVHQRDLLAANNILRQGIAELGSGSKSSKHQRGRSHVSHPRISSLQG